MKNEKDAEQISMLRKAKGLTQNELSETVGVSFQAVSKWERVKLCLTLRSCLTLQTC